MVMLFLYSVNYMITSKYGFTIVELLIVIVVIAILASISIVAYNGISQRANNTARISTANAAIKLVRSYTIAFSAYPVNSNSCIGNGFADSNTRCWGIDSATPSYRNATFNNELLKIGSLPNTTTPPVQSASYQALGPVFSYASNRIIDNVSNPVLIIYFLEGTNQDCGTSGVVRQTGTNEFTSYNGTPNFTSNSGSSTFCYISIPTV